MFIPRKPHPIRNEYHTICCGESGILYAMEVIEGVDHSNELHDDLVDATVNKNGLLLRLTSLLCTTGKVLMLGSGLCIQ